MEIRPITLREANDFVVRYHRHHKGTVGHKFSIGLSDRDKIVGVAICGRPVSRYLDNGKPLKLIAYAQTAQKTLVPCCMARVAGLLRRWAIN